MAANTIEIVVAAKGLNVLTRSLGGAAKAMAAFGTATVAAAGLSVRAFASFEDAFAGVRKTVDATAGEFKILERGIRDMALEIPATVEGISAVAEAAGQLGIQKESILDFTRTMIDLGETTNLTATEAASSLARLANITGLPKDQFDELGSTIVALGNNFATTEREIVEMSLRISGAGSQIGLSEQQILGFSTALSSVGIRAEQGGSAISRVFVDIASAVDQGGAKLSTFAETAGVSVDEFKKSFEKDAGEATIQFIEGLDRISDSGGNVFQTLEKVGFNNIRVRDTLLRAAGAGDLMRGALETANTAFSENTALTDEAAKRYETLVSQFKITVNHIKELGIEIGEKLAPSFIRGLEAVREFSTRAVEVVIKLPEIFAIVTKSLGDMFWKFFSDPEFFALMLRNAGRMGIALVTGMGNVMIELGAIILKAAGVVFAPLAAGATWAIDKIKSVFTGELVPSFEETFVQMSKDAKVNFDTIGQNVDGLKTAFTDAFDDTATLFGGFEEVPEFDALKSQLTELLDGMTEQVGEFAETNKDVLANTFADPDTMDTTKEVWETWFGDWLGSWTDVQAVLQETSQATWDMFKTGVGDAVGAAIVEGENLGQAMKTLMNNIAKSVISALVQIGVQRLAQAILAKVIGVQQSTSRLAALSAETFAGAFAATAAIPIVGPALAPGVAAGAVGAMLSGAGGAASAGASVGGAIASAGGGMENIPETGTFLLHQGERVITKKQNKDLEGFMEGGNGGGGGTISIGELNMFPEATLTEALFNIPQEQWVTFIEETFLDALNEVGSSGRFTTLKFREQGA